MKITGCKTYLLLQYKLQIQHSYHFNYFCFLLVFHSLPPRMGCHKCVFILIHSSLFSNQIIMMDVEYYGTLALNQMLTHWLGQPRSLVIYITCHNCLLESSFPHMSISFSAISGQRSLKLRHKKDRNLRKVPIKSNYNMTRLFLFVVCNKVSSSCLLVLYLHPSHGLLSETMYFSQYPPYSI